MSPECVCVFVQRYPRARAFKRRFVFHAGPTNSGKTHNALERFLSAHTGIYCAPLRMLAHEIYRRSNARGTPCDLLTGDEKQFASGDPDAPSGHLSCTVEMTNTESYCEPLFSPLSLRFPSPYPFYCWLPLSFSSLLFSVSPPSSPFPFLSPFLHSSGSSSFSLFYQMMWQW